MTTCADKELPPEIMEEDVLEAMKDMEGYLDITPGDFKALYIRAYSHAMERLTRSVKAREIMTREVVSVREDTPLAEVAGILARNNISGLPVIDEEQKVVGVISEKDFLCLLGLHDGSFMGLISRCLEGEECVMLPLEQRKAKDLMTQPAVTVTEDTSVSEITHILSTRTINRLPVTDKDGRMTGIVARADVMRGICSAVEPPKRDHGSR
jgi:CBS domain-containing membrane protein